MATYFVFLLAAETNMRTMLENKQELNVRSVPESQLDWLFI